MKERLERERAVLFEKEAVACAWRLDRANRRYRRIIFHLLRAGRLETERTTEQDKRALARAKAGLKDAKEFMVDTIYRLSATHQTLREIERRAGEKEG